MIKITQTEAEMLRSKGRGMDVHLHNKTHKSRTKTYYLTESQKSMSILNEYRESAIYA